MEVLIQSSISLFFLPYHQHRLNNDLFRQLFQDNYIQSRADTMVNIEQTIVELGTIFQQLAHMVHEQDEIVHRFVK